MRSVRVLPVVTLSLCLLVFASVVLTSCGGESDLTTTLSTAVIEIPAAGLTTTTSTAIMTVDTGTTASTTASTSEAPSEQLVQVPQLVGLDWRDAETLLDDCNLECDIEFLLTESVLIAETVMAQLPSAGELVPAHSTVWIQSHRLGARVPDVVGMSEQEASHALLLIELNPDITYVMTLVPSKMGKVIEQDPDPGVLMELWGMVELKIGETTPPASGSVN